MLTLRKRRKQWKLSRMTTGLVEFMFRMILIQINLLPFIKEILLMKLPVVGKESPGDARLRPE